MNRIDFLLRIFYPHHCFLCERIAREDICPECKKQLAYIEEPLCKRCGRPVRYQEQEYCRDCRGRQKNFDAGRSLWLHQKEVSMSLYRFKYHGRKINGRFYARELAERYADQIRTWGIEQIIPVPLHRKRYRKRGYNQAGIVAQELGRLLDIPVELQSVLRSHQTVPQKLLNHYERRQNVKNAFTVADEKALKRCILLIDDIYTTGSTIDELAGVLKRKGVQKVYFLTISIGQGI